MIRVATGGLRMLHKKIESSDEMLEHVIELIEKEIRFQKDKLMDCIEDISEFERGEHHGAFLSLWELQQELENLLKDGCQPARYD